MYRCTGFMYLPSLSAISTMFSNYITLILSDMCRTIARIGGMCNDSGRRGFYSNFQYMTLAAGQMVALGIQIVLQQLLSEPDMKAWGWRIPFIIGAMGAVSVLWLHRTIDESKPFSNIKSQKRRNHSHSYETSESSINSSRPNFRSHCCILYVHNIFTKVHGKHSRSPERIYKPD